MVLNATISDIYENFLLLSTWLNTFCLMGYVLDNLPEVPEFLCSEVDK